MRWSSLIANLQPFCLKSRSCAPKRRRSWFWDPWVFSRVLNDGRTSGAKISDGDTDGYRDEFVLFVMFIHPMADYLRINLYTQLYNIQLYMYIFYIQHVTCLYMFVMVSVHIYIYIWYMSLQLKDDMSTNPQTSEKTEPSNRWTGVDPPHQPWDVDQWVAGKRNDRWVGCWGRSSDGMGMMA